MLPKRKVEWSNPKSNQIESNKIISFQLHSMMMMMTIMMMTMMTMMMMMMMMMMTKSSRLNQIR